MKRDYYRELDEIRNDVISDIKYLLRNNNNEIKIPFTLRRNRFCG